MPRRSRKPVQEVIEQQAATPVAEPAASNAVTLAAPVAVGDATEPVAPADTSFDFGGNESRITREPVVERVRRRGTIGYHFSDGGSAVMTDTGGRIGIRFELPGGKPPAEVLECVKEDRTYGQTVKRGMAWDAKEKEWAKRVENPVADRLEVEGRLKDAAERYRASIGMGAERGR